MFKLLKPKCHSVLGIDINSTSIKAVEILHAGKIPRVIGYGSASLPSGVMDAHLIKEADVVATCVQQVVARAQLRSNYVVLAVPDSVVIHKTVQVSRALRATEIEAFIRMEADKYLPDPLDAISFDFEIIGYSAKNTALLDIMLVASRAEHINSRVAVLAKAGLPANVVDVESFAVERVARLTKQFPAHEKAIAVVDMGAFCLRLFVLHKMGVLFTREEAFSTPLTEAVNEEQAVLNPLIETIIFQIKRTLQFFFSASQSMVIEYLFLAGGVAKLPHLAIRVEEIIKIPTRIANPFAYMQLAKNLHGAELTYDAASWMIACGLALRNAYDSN